MKTRADILIVDDEQVVRLSHLRSLATANFDSTAVGSGFEALSLMACHSFDIVFLDIRMPDMDGIAVLKAIKQRWPECEVIMMTGYPAIETAKQAVKLGAYHYLVKPISPMDVVRAAKEALRHKRWALRKVTRQRNSEESAEHGYWTDQLPPQLAR